MSGKAPVIAHDDDDVRFTFCIKCKKNRSREGLCRTCKGNMLGKVGREPCYQEGCIEMRFKGSLGCRKHAYAENHNLTSTERWADWRRRQDQHSGGTASAIAETPDRHHQAEVQSADHSSC